MMIKYVGYKYAGLQLELIKQFSFFLVATFSVLHCFTVLPFLSSLKLKTTKTPGKRISEKEMGIPVALLHLKNKQKKTHFLLKVNTLWFTM